MGKVDQGLSFTLSRFLGVLAVTMWCTTGISLPKDTQLRERVRIDAPMGWAKLRANLDRVEGSAIKTYLLYDTTGNPELVRSTEKTAWSFKVNGEMICGEEHNLSETGQRKRGSVCACNSRYLFNASRVDENSGWILEHFGQEPWGGKAERHPRAYLRMFGAYSVLQGAWNIGGYHMPDLLNDERFTIYDVRASEGARVRLEFTYRPPANAIQERKLPMNGGWVVLDPTQDWGIIESEIRVDKEDLVFRTSRAYMSVGQAIYLSKFDQTTVSKGKVATRTIFEMTELKGRDVPETEFTLSAYGLPEPIGVTWKKTTPTYVWILVAAGVCGMLTVGFRCLYRRSIRAKP